MSYLPPSPQSPTPGTSAEFAEFPQAARTAQPTARFYKFRYLTENFLRYGAPEGDYHCSECGRKVYFLCEETLWIRCDNCEKFFHAVCVDVQELYLESIEKFHCRECEDIVGPSKMRIITNNHRNDRYEINPSQTIQAGTIAFVQKLKQLEIGPADDIIVKLLGKELTIQYLVDEGFNKPILIENKDGLKMKVPPGDFNLKAIMNYIGTYSDIDVVDSMRQITVRMTMVQFVRIFYGDRQPNTPILNCVSLELSRTPKLNKLIQDPLIVRELSWVENRWPICEVTPRLSKFCIMSMKDSYTDFHIAVGGTTVWYHVLVGEKTFYLIEPTPSNLTIYEEWMKDPHRSDIFLPDMLEGSESCKKFVLTTGQTFFVPCGWITAVLTTEDAIVLSGKFLHNLSIKLQLRIYDMESRLGSLLREYFPYPELTHWYAAPHFIKFLDCFFIRKPPPEELFEAVDILTGYFHLWVEKANEDRSRRSALAPVNLVKIIFNELKNVVRIVRARFDRSLGSPELSNTDDSDVSPIASD